MRVKKISFNDEVYALLAESEDIKDGTKWFGEPFEPLQASRMKYPEGKSFRIHYHTLNPRIIKRTQEAFIVIDGKIAVDIYNKRRICLGTIEAGKGEAIFIYRGGHGIRILEDAIVYEIKAGQFSYVSEDKEFLEDEICTKEMM